MLKARLIHEFSVPLFYRLQSHVNIFNQNCINSALKGLFTSFLHPFQPSVAFRTERRSDDWFLHEIKNQAEMSEKVDANAVFFSYFHFPSYCPVRTDC